MVKIAPAARRRISWYDHPPSLAEMSPCHLRASHVVIVNTGTSHQLVKNWVGRLAIANKLGRWKKKKSACSPWLIQSIHSQMTKPSIYLDAHFVLPRYQRPLNPRDRSSNAGVTSGPCQPSRWAFLYFPSLTEQVPSPLPGFIHQLPIF